MTALNGATYLTRGGADFARSVFASRRLILDLTRREFRGRYLGTAFGLIWAFVHPSVLTLIYFLVFRYALKSAGPVTGPAVAGNPAVTAPFVVWLLNGLVPWFIAADAVAAGSGAVLDNRFLVKKVVFRVSLLPVVRLLSLLPVHLFFIAAITIIDWGYGFPPSWYSLQAFYYLGCLMLAALGWSLFISAITPFLKDFSQVVQVLLQVLFWWTPLVWQIETAPEWVKKFLYLNPLYYVVQGYRDSLVYHVAFWHHPEIGAYFWGVTVVLLVAGGITFARLRPHFADVL
jgi:ABC-type polysaccharide/polyol phosphate export permease